MKGITQDQLIQKMVGREIRPVRKSSPIADPEKLLEVREISLQNPLQPSEKIVHNISFQLAKGEILGIFGLMGAGRTELLETIFGLHSAHSSGEVWIEGENLGIPNTSQAIRAGMALVPEDRKKDGLVLDLDVQTNISLTTLENLESWGLLNFQKEKELAKGYISQLQVKTSSAKQLVRNLSGGNQQKIVLAKWLATNPKMLMLDEPTRGIDIHAKNEIYRLILELAEKGLGILMVSSELPEILAVSDRVLVLSEGHLTAEFSSSEATEDRILKASIPQTL